MKIQSCVEGIPWVCIQIIAWLILVRLNLRPKPRITIQPMNLVRTTELITFLIWQSAPKSVW